MLKNKWPLNNHWYHPRNPRPGLCTPLLGCMDSKHFQTSIILILAVLSLTVLTTGFYEISDEDVL